MYFCDLFSYVRLLGNSSRNVMIVEILLHSYIINRLAQKDQVSKGSPIVIIVFLHV